MLLYKQPLLDRSSRRMKTLRRHLRLIVVSVVRHRVCGYDPIWPIASSASNKKHLSKIILFFMPL